MWIYNGKVLSEIPTGAVGFVYIIHRENLDVDVSSPIKYIGKKNFYVQKGKKESDWKKYYGSSEWLKKHVNRYTEDVFRREILRICYSKSEMTYHEVMLQISEDVLRVDKTAIMKKKFYNLNILGKFFKSKDFSKEELKQIKEYINTGSEDYDRICVTNGEKTRYINTLVDDIESWLIENPEWCLGSSFSGPVKDKILVTDGKDSIYINKNDVHNFLEDNHNWYVGSHTRGTFKCVNNGIEQRRIHIDELNYFLEHNKEYVEGNLKTGNNPYIHIYNNELNLNMYVRNSDLNDYLLDNWELQKGVPKGRYVWVCKNDVDKKIDVLKIDEYKENGWIDGRTTASNKNKVCITDGAENKYINKNDDIPDNWYVGSTQNKNQTRKIKYIYNTLTNEPKTVLADELDEFLLNNPEYTSGKNYSYSEDKVFAINMITLERIEMTKAEFTASDIHTTMKTKKVKIKKNNRILFTGYLKIYLRDNNIPERFYKEALKRENGELVGKTKAYEWITGECITIKYI